MRSLTSAVIEQRLRRFLLLMAGGLFIGTPVELLLAEHTESALQWVPFVLCGVGLLAIGAALFSPQRNILIALRWVMVAVAIGSAIGVYQHLLGNLEFELEIRAGISRSAAFWAALQGASPLLAPGILGLAAVLALAATYYHPAIIAR